MNEFSLETRIKVLMNKYNFRFRKSLGQNFLINETVLNDIVYSANLAPDDKVLEIGPGMGFLTEKLSNAAGLVTAVELDDRLCTILRELYANADNIIIRHDDGLKLDFEQVAEEGEKRGFTNPFKIVANLPYYITTPLLFYFLENSQHWSEMILMVQKEVAQRINAVPGTKDYGVLTLMVAYYANTEIAMEVPAAAFKPRPNVDSAVIRLIKSETPPAPVDNKNLFDAMVKAGFGQRRKTLANALTNSGLGLTKDEVYALLATCDIDPKRRGETLDFAEYANLANVVNSNRG